MVWPNGNIRHIQAKAVLHKDEKGRPLKMIGTNWDITPIKEAQIKYNETAERLKVATNAAKIGIWEFDVVAGDLVWNDQMFELYGVKREEFAGDYEAWKSTVHQDDKERSQKEMEMAINGEKDIDTEFRVVWPNGNIRHLKATAVLLKDKEGRTLKMIVPIPSLSILRPLR